MGSASATRYGFVTGVASQERQPMLCTTLHAPNPGPSSRRPNGPAGELKKRRPPWTHTPIGLR
eukprot:10117762-Alexandrium_andersonii.AAC.1